MLALEGETPVPDDARMVVVTKLEDFEFTNMERLDDYILCDAL